MVFDFEIFKPLVKAHLAVKADNKISLNANILRAGHTKIRFLAPKQNLGIEPTMTDEMSNVGSTLWRAIVAKIPDM
jgi:hypothetical protein